MADGGTIQITGLEERIKQMGNLATDNPMMKKRINEVIRKALAGVRKNLQNQARSGLQIQDDPRKAYKAVRMAVYRRLFGGQVNILKSRRTHSGGRYYEPQRHPSKIGGNRRPQSMMTRKRMSYEGPDRGFVLRFLNAGTKERNIQHLVEVKRADGTSKFRWRNENGEYGKRGSIAARNWFGDASLRELERASLEIDEMIDNIIAGIMF